MMIKFFRNYKIWNPLGSFGRITI